MIRRILFFIPVALMLGILFFFSQGLHQDPRELPSTLINKPAPHFSLTELHSHKVITQKIFLGHTTLLNVWGSWCESCQEEQAALIQIHQQYPSLVIIGLNYKDTPAHANAWLKRFGNPYSLILEDNNGDVGINYGVYGTPESFLINAQGVIIAKHVGVLTVEDFKSMVEKALPPKLHL